MTLQTRVDRRKLSIESMARVTGGTVKIFMSDTGVHIQPSLSGRHRWKVAAQSHAVTTFDESFNLSAVAGRTNLVRNRVTPNRRHGFGNVIAGLRRGDT